MSRLIPHPLLSLALLVTWALLNGTTRGSLLLGAGLALAIPAISAAFWTDRPSLRRPHLMIPYIALVLFDIIRANIQVAWIIVTWPDSRLRSAFLTVPLDLTHPEAITLLASTITLTPGTLTADIAEDGRSLRVHALHAPDPEATIADIKSRYEARLKRIFV